MEGGDFLPDDVQIAGQSAVGGDLRGAPSGSVPRSWYAGRPPGSFLSRVCAHILF